MVRSPQFEPGMVSRVSKSLLWWKTAPETCGSEWMTDCICSRMGASAAYLNRITSRLDWCLDWPRTRRKYLGGVRRHAHSLCVSVISRCKKSSLAAQVPAGRIAPNPHGGIWIGTRNGELGLFRNGALQKIPVNPDAKSPFANQIIAQPDGSVLAAFDDGLVGLRQGKVQRMTTKNGLPCNEVMSFIEDKEKRWWLNTQCGIVEFSDSELQRWWANPDAVIQTRSTTYWTAPVHPHGHLSMQPQPRPMGACGL